MTQSEAPIRLRLAEFDRLTALRGLDTDAKRARALKISQAHMSNIRAGRDGIGSKFIAGCLAVFGGAMYDALFDHGEDPAAVA